MSNLKANPMKKLIISIAAGTALLASLSVFAANGTTATSSHAESQPTANRVCVWPFNC